MFRLPQICPASTENVEHKSARALQPPDGVVQARAWAYATWAASDFVVVIVKWRPVAPRETTTCPAVEQGKVYWGEDALQKDFLYLAVHSEDDDESDGDD